MNFKLGMIPKPITSQRLNNLPSNFEAISSSVLRSSGERLQVTLLMAAPMLFYCEIKYCYKKKEGKKAVINKRYL